MPCRSGGGWQKRKGSSGCVRYEGSIYPGRAGKKERIEEEGVCRFRSAGRRQKELFFVANFCHGWGKRREREEEEEEEEMLCLLLAIYLSRPHNNSLFFLR